MGSLTSVMVRDRGIYKNIALLGGGHGICVPLLALNVEGAQPLDELLV